MDIKDTGVELYEWNEPGYKPLVFHQDWMVALLNWEPACLLENAHEIERHNLTDEVFLLLHGQAILYVNAGAGLRSIAMKPGALYNVRAGVWHNLLATRDARWVIVEARGTDLHDTEIRKLNEEERLVLFSAPLAWAKCV